MQLFLILRVYFSMQGRQKIAKTADNFRDDHELVESILKGNLQAFQNLIEKYENLVRYIVFPMIAKPEDREEICQEIFIKVYQNLAKFQCRSRLSTWIGRIAYHHCLNWRKKKKVPLYEDMGSPPGSPIAESNKSLFPDPHSCRILAPETPPDEAVENSERNRFLLRTVGQLPAHYRTIISLFHLEELSIGEISAMLNMPSGTVKSHLFRARKLLKQQLLKYFTREDLML